MKICFFTQTLYKGGAERVISNLSNYIINSEKINSIDIITMYNTDIEYKLDDKINVYSIDKKYVEYKKLLNNHKGFFKILKKVKKALKNIKRKKLLKKILINNKYDLIISFLPEPSFMILSLKRFIKCPIIVSERNDPNVEYSNLRSFYLMNKYYPKADGFVFQTDEARNYFKNINIKRFAIIPNPVNNAFIVERYEGKKEQKIVNVARLNKQKNQLLLIKAFEKIKDEIKHYNLVIYGEGPLRKELQDYINKNNLSNRVFLPGMIDDVKEKIYKASLFVLSSDYEGLPNALIEAMCLGLPVISTDCPCGGPRSLIKNNENGILVEVNNLEQMSQSIKRVILDNDLSNKLGSNASKISSKVSNSEINNKWLEFIEKIIEENKNNF